MVKRMLVEKSKNGFYTKDIEIVGDCNSLSPFMSKLGKRVFETISLKPMYPSEIARELGENEQKIYYHIHQMKKNGLVKVAYEEEKNGALCKFYAPVSLAYGFDFSKDNLKVKTNLNKDEHLLKKFFDPFIGSGVFNGFFVIGSPVQHGPYLTVARDGHYAIPLSLLLGSFCSPAENMNVMLDIELISQKKYKENIILIGGPVTNMVCSEVNNNLKVKFVWKEGWVLEHDKRTYSGPGIGLICNIKNPWDASKRIIVLAGLDFVGTKTCVRAISSLYNNLLKNYVEDQDFYAVLKSENEGKIKVLDSFSS